MGHGSSNIRKLLLATCSLLCGRQCSYVYNRAINWGYRNQICPTSPTTVETYKNQNPEPQDCILSKKKMHFTF